MLSRADHERSEQIERIVAYLRERLDAAARAEIEGFVRRYYARVAAEDVVGHPVEELYAAALSLWKFGARRRPGELKLRVFNPTVETQGWRTVHTVIEVVNDDMPFLVDSVAAAVHRRDIALHALIHPIVAVRRDAAGARLGLAEGGEAGAIGESMMHVEIDRQGDPAVLAAIEAELGGVLADVRAAVEDWRTMLDRLQACLRALADSPPPLPADEVAEGRALLEWMGDNHFTFLGYREYDYRRDGSREAAAIVPGSGLGLLRDPERRVMRMAGGAEAADLAPEAREFLHRPELLLILKANLRSTVHRPVHLDFVSVKRFDAAGAVAGERRFVGLFTSAAYNRNPREIPYLRRKVRRIFERSGLSPISHDGKALQNILDTFPRDELFQITEEDLERIAQGILLLQERPRIRLFVRRDKFQRFVSCLIYTPRDRYSSELRRRFEEVLREAFAGRISAYYTQIGDEPLARVHVIVATTPGQVPEPDIEAVEARLVRAARGWRDDLAEALVEQAGEEAGVRLGQRYGDAFPTAYREQFDALAALADIEKCEALAAAGGLALNLYRPLEAAESELRLKLYKAGAPVPLSDCLPVLECMGLRVMEERPFEVRPQAPAGAAAPAPVWIHDFRLADPAGRAIDLDRAKAKFEAALLRVWRGEAESDNFNRLVLTAGLEWREVGVLRAYAKYLRQAGVAFSQDYMERALAAHPALAAALVALFRARFDPAGQEGREGRIADAAAAVEAGLEAVASLDEDRIIRRFLNAIQATLRANFYQRGGDGEPKPYLAFKLDSAAVAELPAPRPYAEIFVHSPRVEGVHLRGGKVARGGIRWSDRREDFRTEVLGLMKAQMVKNAVIVPVGAKGGFVPKRPPPDGDREAILADGVACYRIFIGGLLDLTDNLAGAGLRPPADVVRHDGDDPYLVVAADKGTATFSDIANALALDYGFWLGDAFASGGSSGYDHKKMGITARGAFELIKRHFRELGKDILAEDFTAVGIGDMSGDVFGNGMLLSRHVRLIAAFDHRHIFVDPDPDPAASWAERKRLFELPRSSWADYRPELISPGGAVFDRRKKSLALTPEIKARLGIGRDALTPSELVQAVLRAEVDLLWNGGIGTFVKAADESHAEVGDRANDAVRVDARELRCRVVGEGGNLGFSQRGRIEYALHGGRINTDAVDNSAGVDCSDHEVNIKILLGSVVAEGEMTGKQRDRLLAEMTDEVAALVLNDNYLQGQAISLAAAEAPAALDGHARFIRALEKRGRLDRALEFLPDDEAIAERRQQGLGLTRPELAVLMAYAKMTLNADLLESDLPDDPYFAADLARYFPEPLRQRFAGHIERHRLRREIVATSVANSVVNRAGLTFVAEIEEESRAGVGAVARAYTVARDAFDLRALWAGIAALDNKVAASEQYAMLLAIRDLHRRATLWFLRNGAQPLAIAPAIAAYRPGIAALAAELEALVPDETAAAMRAAAAERVARGVPAPLAQRVAGLGPLGAGPDIVAAAAASGRPVVAVARVYFALGGRLGLDWLRGAAAAQPPAGHWERLALGGVVDDLYRCQRELTQAVLAAAARAEGGAAVATWAATRRAAVERVDQLVAELRAQGPLDLARLAIAARTIHGSVAAAP